MSYIHFNKLSFRNFMSYGNNLNVFDFPDGLVWCHADNGFGKSTIVEALNFALFGTSYRGGNKAELRNTKNTDCNLEVSVEFGVRQGLDDDPVEYRICRSMNPAGKIKFELERMEDGKYVTQNKRAGYSQVDFEDNILCFNEVLFKNVIAMNTQESLPFIAMPAAKRRELLESIIAMPLDGWKKANSKRLSEASMEFDVASGEYGQLVREISNIESVISTLRSEKEANVSAMKTERDALVASRDTEKGIYDSISAKIDACGTRISEISGKIAAEPTVKERLTALRNAYNALGMLPMLVSTHDDAKHEYDKAVSLGTSYTPDEWKSEVSRIEREISTISSENATIDRELYHLEVENRSIDATKADVVSSADSLVPGVQCPTCGKPSTEADVERQKTVLRNKWKALNSSAKENNARIAELNDAKVSNNGRIDTLNTDLSNINAKLSEYTVYVTEKLNPAKRDYDIAAQRLDTCRRTIGDGADDLEVVNAGIAEAEAELSRIDGLKTEHSTEMIARTGYVAENTSRMNKIRDLDSRIQHLDTEIDRITSGNVDDALSVAETQLDNAIESRNNTKDRIDKASDIKSLCAAITEMCSDGGMKKMVFGIFVPAFNKAVQRNLRHANLPFDVVFDDSMNFTFQSPPGLAPSYAMLSQGQKRKVGFAISMAFRDFVSMVGNFRVNFMSLDEVLDISTDDNAMRDMLGIIRGMVSDIGCASVITHRGTVVADMFDYKLPITYNGAYSRISELVKL